MLAKDAQVFKNGLTTSDMSRRFILTIILTVLSAAYAYAVVIEKIVAIVNDKVITMTDFEEEVAVIRQLGKNTEKRAVLDSMIECEIALTEAGRLGIPVTVNEVTAEMLKFEETFPSREDFELFLTTYELSLKDLSRRFSSYLVLDKVRQQKEAVSAGRYEKWLSEAKRKADIKILDNGQ